MARAFILFAGLMLSLGAARPAAACSLCEGSGLTKLTLRQEAALGMARVILHGTISDPAFGDDGKGGRTDFHVKTVFRRDKDLATPDKVVLGRFLPVDDPKSPPHYLLFCDVDGKRLDPYRGIPLRGGARSADYVKKALALDAKKSADNLPFFFSHLDDADPEVSSDAFLEFAKASDADVLKAAASLDPAKLRSWIADPKTPSIRASVYGLLLGACGKEADATFLRERLDETNDRDSAAADGYLAGYIVAKPKEGWALARAILSDGRKPLLTRLGVVRTLRFFRGARPTESRPHLIEVFRGVLAQGDLADVAVEDLRKWQMWDLTDDVLKRYGQKGFDAPLMKRAVVRYALSCPETPATRAFLAARRASEGEMVTQVEDGLKLEKK